MRSPAAALVVVLGLIVSSCGPDGGGPEECVPECGARECGDDGCGGSCGECGEGELCTESFLCEPECVPDCSGRCCGDDGCGGVCPDVCAGDEMECDPETCACVPVSPCGTEVELPTCGETSPPPTGFDEMEAFVAETALPMKCRAAGREHWDFASVEADAEGSAVFMFGEVHYSEELGPTSAALFEDLVRRGVVDTLALEYGMDATEAMQTFVHTGAGPLSREYYIEMYPPSMFIRLLLETAHELYREGYEIRVVGVDSPERMDWVNDQLEAMGAAFGPEARGLLLDTMPIAPRGYMVDVPPALVAESRAYYDHVRANLDTICAGLSDEVCERVEMLARSLWLAAFLLSGSFDTADTWEVWEYFETREPLIFYNYRTQVFTGEEGGVYAHMGAAHTAKWAIGFASTASLLDQELSTTAGLVYTTAPSYGEGSEIGYEGYSLMPLDADPAVVAAALQHEEVDTWFVSTRLPSEACVGNPLVDLDDAYLGVPLGRAYDALVFVRALSPMTWGPGGKRALPEAARRAIDLHLREREAEAALLGR